MSSCCPSEKPKDDSRYRAIAAKTIEAISASMRDWFEIGSYEAEAGAPESGHSSPA